MSEKVEPGMKVVRRYLMRVDPFTLRAPVYELRVELVPNFERLWVRVLEFRDSGFNKPLVDMYEHEVHIEIVAKHALGWGLRDLADALDAEQLRGHIERRAAHQLFLAIATDTDTPHGFAKPWACEWLPEWAAWWDNTMSQFRAEAAKLK